MAFDVHKHFLVPKHSKVSEAEKKKLLGDYNISGKDLPKILKTDSAIASLNVKESDIIKIERKSKTAGISVYYRIVYGN